MEIREGEKIRLEVYSSMPCLLGRRAMAQWDNLSSEEKKKRERWYEDRLNEAGRIDQANGTWNLD